jgi:hypothetical protein
LLKKTDESSTNSKNASWWSGYKAALLTHVDDIRRIVLAATEKEKLIVGVFFENRSLQKNK